MGRLIAGFTLMPRPARARLVAFAVLTVLAMCPPPSRASVPTIRATYVYDHMDPAHVEALSAAALNRVVIRLAGDSLGTGGASALREWTDRARARGLDPVPEFLFQAESRLGVRPGARRYTWGSGASNPAVACPLDSAYWRTALFDRAEEILAVVPDLKRIAVDLEFPGGLPKHYDAGPCRCGACLAEYTGGRATVGNQGAGWRYSGLSIYEEARICSFVSAMAREFATRHPGVEWGVFDLDLDSFAHRGFARALARTGLPVTDYCERSYSVGGGPLRGARARLDALGLSRAALVGGLWLKRFAPRDVPAGLRSIAERADGYFIFTTYSLGNDPSNQGGPYALLGTPADYWQAITEVNEQP